MVQNSHQTGKRRKQSRTDDEIERKYAHKHGCRPPKHSVSLGPFGLGMIMTMLAATREHRFLEQVRSWHRAYGTTFKATMIVRKAIFTVEPKNVQTVLALKFKDFELGEYRNRAVRPLLGYGIFSTDGSVWEHSRALLRPNFTRNQIADISVYETHVAHLIKQIPRDGSTVDLQDLFFRMTLDSATEFLFGESVHSLGDAASAPASSFAADFNASQRGLALRSRLGSLMMFYRDKQFSNAVADARSYVDRFVQKAIDYRIALDNGQYVSEEARKVNEQQYVFLHELSKRTLNKTELTDQLLNILLAGRDTTASLLSITFFTMARRPDIWNKLRQEVLALGGRKPSFEDLKSMTYLTWVLNETLRLYPVVPINVRMANKDTVLPVGGGHRGKDPVFVPKGYEVIYSVYTMHRLPEIFGDDADEYRPERWEKLKPGWAYIPFNGGPRICLGQQFALTEAGYTTVRLMQQFEAIESRDPKPLTEGLTLTLASLNGTKVAMKPAKGS
ncbi:cytochrome P450 [Aspergillus fischeri NRRL 181]|uniref:N-alkane-inducible cytochrome P450 n=1 Tax=Neosartorya fischeri (strain ATCC 1020 / DSM 3700 / CBS 544.65 / FGSC A1164 / JCM 1740 / NRRL 181 / WB 181) TaxID=331117 RepID=A1D653_NEOFI|nr:n-alkane-inducible cytochrome P450 [Aspergillus fischeri NRRL 181]EAW21197.1 n-alkane-inducible cytochrome P450 [Aspergillus fischeri NRRL 181]